MAKIILAEGKKRYSVSLREDNVKRFQAACKALKLPPSTMSQACDDVLRDLSGVLEQAIAKGHFSIRDIFKMLGEQMELLHEEEKGELRDKEKVSSLQSKENAVVGVQKTY